MSTFSPVGSRSSDGMRVCVCVCVDGMNLKYALPWHIHISVHSIHASAVHKHMHTRILKPFEDSEPTGLIVDIPLHSVFAAFLYGADCVLLQWLLHLVFCSGNRQVMSISCGQTSSVALLDSGEVR